MKEFTSKKELLEYIGQAIEVESNVLSQQNLIKEYDENREQYKPHLVLQEEPECRQVDTRTEDVNQGYAELYALVAFLVAGGIAFISLIVALAGTNSVGGWLLAIVAGGIGALLLFSASSEKQKANGKIEAVQKKHEHDVQCVQENNKKLQKQYYSELCSWQAENDEAHSYFAKPLAETQEVLKNLYSADVIYPKYRNLPALTSIYEYLITGRCEELTGPHGAYNLYEDEVRKDMIISQMNQVIQNLEQIKANQYKLYEEVCKIRESSQAAVNELRALHGYAAELTGLASLTAYYTGIAASNTSAMIYYHRLYL